MLSLTVKQCPAETMYDNKVRISPEECPGLSAALGAPLIFSRAGEIKAVSSIQMATLDPAVPKGTIQAGLLAREALGVKVDEEIIGNVSPLLNWRWRPHKAREVTFGIYVNNLEDLEEDRTYVLRNKELNTRVEELLINRAVARGAQIGLRGVYAHCLQGGQAIELELILTPLTFKLDTSEAKQPDRCIQAGCITPATKLNFKLEDEEAAHQISLYKSQDPTVSKLYWDMEVVDKYFPKAIYYNLAIPDIVAALRGSGLLSQIKLKGAVQIKVPLKRADSWGRSSTEIRLTLREMVFKGDITPAKPVITNETKFEITHPKHADYPHLILVEQAEPVTYQRASYATQQAKTARRNPPSWRQELHHDPYRESSSEEEEFEQAVHDDLNQPYYYGGDTNHFQGYYRR